MLSTAKKLTRVLSSSRDAVEQPHERAVRQVCENTVDDVRLVATRCSRSEKKQVVLKEEVLSSGGFIWVSRGSYNSCGRCGFVGGYGDEN